MAEPDGPKLKTWKEIGHYVGRDERTAKRWEASRGLPVRRAPGANRSTVYAYCSELDAWLLGHAAEPGPDALPPAGAGRGQRSWRWGLAAAGIAAAAVAGLAFLAVGPGRAHDPLSRAQASAKAAPELYMKGLYAWHTRTRAGLSDAIADFSQVILHDPDYAPAYAGLADCYNLMPEFGGMAPSQAYPQAKVAAERAVALDDRLASAHRALAFVDFWWSHDVQESRRQFERSLSLDPRAALTHHWYANTLAMVGDFPKAVREIQEAERLDPSTTAIIADKAVVLFDAGRTAEAIDILKTVESAQPDFAPAHSYLSTIYFVQGDEPQAIEQLAAAARLTGDGDGLSVADAAARGYRQAGRSGMTRAILAQRARLWREGRYSPYSLAEAYAASDPDRAFALLDASLARGEPIIMALRVDPTLRPLRGDRRFGSLLAAVHLPALPSTRRGQAS